MSQEVSKKYWDDLKAKIEADVTKRCEKVTDLKKYLSHISNSGQPEELARLNYYIGRYYFIKQKNDVGVTYIKRAIRLAEQAQNYETLCYCYNYLSGYHIVKQNEIAAIESLFMQKKYVAYLNKEEQYRQLYSINANIASLHRDSNREGALKYYREALRYINKFKAPDIYYSVLYKNMIDVYLGNEQYEEALKCGEILTKKYLNSNELALEFEVQVQMLYARLRMDREKVTNEEIASVCDKMLELSEPSVYDIRTMEQMSIILGECGMRDWQRLILDRVGSFLTGLGMSDVKDYWAQMAELYKGDGNTEKYRETCEKLYEIQKELDEYGREEDCKRLKQYIEVKEEEYRQLEMTRQHEELKRKSNYDELTGMPNRYMLNSFCEEAFAEAITLKKHMAVTVIDIDYFKQMNDSYGHLAGDRCLKAVADVVRRYVPRGGICARYGGDEFVIVCMNHENSFLKSNAAMMGQSVIDLDIPNEYSKVASVVTISQGIVNRIPKTGEGIYEFIKLADEALYDAKKKSRNTVVMWSEDN